MELLIVIEIVVVVPHVLGVAPATTHSELPGFGIVTCAGKATMEKNE